MKSLQAQLLKNFLMFTSHYFSEACSGGPGLAAECAANRAWSSWHPTTSSLESRNYMYAHGHACCDLAWIWYMIRNHMHDSKPYAENENRENEAAKHTRPAITRQAGITCRLFKHCATRPPRRLRHDFSCPESIAGPTVARRCERLLHCYDPSLHPIQVPVIVAESEHP